MSKGIIFKEHQIPHAPGSHARYAKVYVKDVPHHMQMVGSRGNEDDKDAFFENLYRNLGNLFKDE